MAKDTKIDKGGHAEEAFRQYFRDSGCFVLRGIPVRQENEDITDIDLWVYTRNSPYNRWITQVDIKNKKRSKGFERAIWAKGLLFVTGANEAMIVSSTAKNEVKELAKKIGVKVISANVFSSIQKRYVGVGEERYSYEEIFATWQGMRSDGFKSLASRIDSARERFGDGLEFSDLNYLIDSAAVILLDFIDHERKPAFVFRALLFCLSMVAVAADYLSKDFAFEDQETRKKKLTSGLIFGRLGEDVVENYVGFAEKAVKDFVDPSGASSAMVRMGLKKAVEDLPINQFAEFLAKPTAGRELMNAALELEARAFDRKQPELKNLGASAQMLLLLLADYAGVDRRKLLLVHPPSGDGAVLPNPDGAKGDLLL